MLRNILFWTIDRLTGNKKKSNYNDVSFILKDQNASKTQNKKKAYLQTVLQHAINTVPYYQNKQPKLSSFPVINKNNIRDNFEDFQSKTYVDLYKKTVSTSGSTGTPFKVYHNKNKVIRNTADNLFFWKKAGYTIGDKLYFFRLWNAFEKKNSLSQTVQNIIPIDVFDLTDTYIDNLLNTFKKNKKKPCLLGYASAFEKICKHLDKTNPNFRINTIKSIIAISEKLNQYTKQSVKKYFGVEPISRYSNIENGIIAQQPIGKPYFIINEASYYIEILSLDSDQPSANGTIGRIVVTDLFNYTMPMIRYDTGDLGIIDTLEGKTVFTQIHGREIDTIKNTKGEIISFNLVLMVNNYPQLKQCQLIQKTNKGYVLKLNAGQTFKKEEELLLDFKKYLGADADITIVYVSEIPLLTSGKRRVMVNEVAKHNQDATLNP